MEFSDLVFDEIIAAQTAMREEASTADTADESIETEDRQEGTRASEDDRTTRELIDIIKLCRNIGEIILKIGAPCHGIRIDDQALGLFRKRRHH